MTDRDPTHLHPDLQPLHQQWESKCHAQSINVLTIETYRSAEEQAKDYAVGRDVNGNHVGRILTDAKPGQSPHNFTLPDGTPASKAFDFTILKTDGSCNWDIRTPQWKAAVAIGKALGLKWGGDFKFIDADHFELP